MSDAKHTAGPWHDVAPMNPEGAAHRVITGGPDGLPHIAYIPKNGYAPTAVEARANARLIAAAPELLAACEAALAGLYCQHRVTDTGDICGVTYTCLACQRRPQLEAAIAKAKGH